MTSYTAAMMRMIAAVDAELGIADDDGIPWDLPSDKEFFVATTRNGLILMGHATYTEFDSPMHARTNYVATHRTQPLRDGFVAVADPVAFAADHRHEVIQNIGGAGLFAATLHLADELVLTRIEDTFGCTKFFPAFADTFERTSRSEPHTENGITFAFETWVPRRR